MPESTSPPASRREAILAAVFDALRDLSGIHTCGRNLTADLSDGARPAIVLYDGDETLTEGKPGRGLMALEAEVRVAVSAPDESLGTALNALVARVQTAVLTAPDVLALTASPPQMTAARFAVGRGRRGEAIANLTFSLPYALNHAAP
jgi:hypothetical protein